MESPHDFLRRKLFDHFAIFCQGRCILLKKVAVTHRNTVISHLIYMKFSFASVCVVSSGRLFFHKGNIDLRESELQFNCDHNDVPTILKIDIGLAKNCVI